MSKLKILPTKPDYGPFAHPLVEWQVMLDRPITFVPDHPEDKPYDRVVYTWVRYFCGRCDVVWRSNEDTLVGRCWSCGRFSGKDFTYRH
jgi:hypothetical protein